MSDQTQTEQSNLSESAKKCMKYLPEATAACRRTDITKMSNSVMDPNTPTTEQQLIDCCVAIETVRQVKLEEVKGNPEGQTVIENFFQKLQKNVKQNGQKNIEASLKPSA